VKKEKELDYMHKCSEHKAGIIILRDNEKRREKKE